ncbi:CRTAC1 family protein [Halioglobus maricola]|uniref:CRTAC1 family protein n=1 Tax=Halioglobus maricola TaxID=2601894 RepID=A0A5P9NFP0_9GAMM|nr:CRTAC1 family protein [Halioglobus maricola]QFU74326.1 CRTAC1 family protein [Halioglobus maricola]
MISYYIRFRPATVFLLASLTTFTAGCEKPSIEQVATHDQANNVHSPEISRGHTSKIHFDARHKLLAYDRKIGSWGMAIGDVDNDGDMDIWLSQHHNNTHDEAALLLNRLDEGAGAFVVHNMPPGGDQHGAVWVDFDGDGDKDLLQLQGGGKGGKVTKPIERIGNQLFINAGLHNGAPQLHFPEATPSGANSRGLIYAHGRGRLATPLDINNDSRLDFFIGNSARDDGQYPSAIFIQKEGNQFELAKNALGQFSQGAVLAVPADFDGDKYTDLFLLRDSNLSNEIVLWRDGRYLAPGDTLRIPKSLRKSIAKDVLVQDFNGDGLADIWLAIAKKRGDPGADRLYLRDGDKFIEVSKAAGIRAERFNSLNAVAGDFDNDGDLDVYTVNSDYTPAEIGVNEVNAVWENRGNKMLKVKGTRLAVPQFTPLTGDGFAPSEDNGRAKSVALADFNNDGNLDFLVANGSKGAKLKDVFRRGTYDLFLGRNEADNGWLTISLTGTSSNIEGIGATIRVTSHHGTQVRFAAHGLHAMTQNDTRIHFGLGQLAADETLSVEVAWPSGIVQQIPTVQPNQTLEVLEPAESNTR